MACSLTSGFSGLSCAEIQDVAGGLKVDVYLGNLSDLVQLHYDGNGYVSSIQMTAYTNLYKFTGTRNGNTATSDIAQQTGGNVFYTQSVTLSLQDVTPAQKTALEELGSADGVFAIIATSNGAWNLFGSDLGLIVTSAVKNFGLTPQDATNRTVVLSGIESSIEKVLSMIPASGATGNRYVDTKAVLDAMLAA